jgi:competence protein ComEC
VLDALNGVSAMIYGTGVNGTVVVTSDGLDISVKTAREGTVVAGVSAAEKDRQEQETAAQDEAQQSQEDKDETVYIAPSGNKYHRSGCRYLRKSGGGTPISKKDAEARGLTPCSVCNP